MPTAGPVLVTGASGFVGTHLVRHLIAGGHDVVALVRQRSRAPSGTEVIEADVANPRAVLSAVQRCVSVVHLAGMTSVRGASVRQAFRANVVGTMNVVDACRSAGIGRLIVLSTQSENIGVYARTKREADRMVLESNTPHVILRPSLVYGSNAGGVFGAIVQSIRKLPAIPIVGSGEYPMRPVYVDDVCYAISAVLRRQPRSEEYFLSGGDTIKYRDFIRLLCELQGLRRPLVSVPFAAVAFAIAAGEALHLPLPIGSDTLRGLVRPQLHDSVAAERDLGFHPTSLEEGLRRTFA